MDQVIRSDQSYKWLAHIFKQLQQAYIFVTVKSQACFSKLQKYDLVSTEMRNKEMNWIVKYAKKSYALQGSKLPNI